MESVVSRILKFEKLTVKGNSKMKHPAFFCVMGSRFEVCPLRSHFDVRCLQNVSHLRARAPARACASGRWGEGPLVFPEVFQVDQGCVAAVGCPLDAVLCLPSR